MYLITTILMFMALEIFFFYIAAEFYEGNVNFEILIYGLFERNL